MTNAFRALLDDPTRQPSIIESAFRDIFLPKFVAGDRDSLKLWIDEIAIKPFSPVRVVLDDDRDTTLFTVPGFFKGPNLPESGNISMFLDSVNRLTQAGYGPNVVNNAIEKNLGPYMKEGIADQDDIDVWHDILVRYGYASLEKKETLHKADEMDMEEDEW